MPERGDWTRSIASCSTAVAAEASRVAAPVLAGPRVALCPLRDEDSPILHRWINDRALVVLSAPYRPVSEAQPYVPAPAIPPMPPDAIQHPPDTRPAPPGRGPLVPEPHAVSAPLPHPEPITPPLPVTPAPDERRDRRRPGDDEFVDWVSGLGSRDDDR